MRAESPSGTPVAWLSGNPPAALDSPDAWLSGNPPAAGCRHRHSRWLNGQVRDCRKARRTEDSARQTLRETRPRHCPPQPTKIKVFGSN